MWMKNKFAGRLSELISESGKTQNFISAELHIPKQKLSNWKTAYTEPNLDDLCWDLWTKRVPRRTRDLSAVPLEQRVLSLDDLLRLFEIGRNVFGACEPFDAPFPQEQFFADGIGADR